MPTGYITRFMHDRNGHIESNEKTKEMLPENYETRSTKFEKFVKSNYMEKSGPPRVGSSRTLSYQACVTLTT